MTLDDAFTPENGGTELDLTQYGNIDDIPAQHAVAEGEYHLLLVSAEIKDQKPEKGSGRFLQATMEVMDDPNAKLISHVMMLPSEDDNDRKKNNRLRAIGDFLKAFSIPSSGSVNFAQYEGNMGWAVLRVETSDDYGDQNKIRRFITGK